MAATLYRLYDSNGSLLYIGVTERTLDQRLREHRGDKEWWPRVAWTSCMTFADRITAIAAESAAIRSERPSYNGGIRSRVPAWQPPRP